MEIFVLISFYNHKKVGQPVQLPPLNMNKMKICYLVYKRAQRALGRSPEEKVKGHSGANNRDPQRHNLNNFGKGPFDDAIY